VAVGAADLLALGEGHCPTILDVGEGAGVECPRQCRTLAGPPVAGAARIPIVLRRALMASVSPTLADRMHAVGAVEIVGHRTGVTGVALDDYARVALELIRGLVVVGRRRSRAGRPFRMSRTVAGLAE